jgi:hypothetical protein
MSWISLVGDAATVVAATKALNAQGWTIMLVSVGSVVSLTFYCIRRVLQLPTEDIEDIKGPLEIDTGDTQNAD